MVARLNGAVSLANVGRKGFEGFDCAVNGRQKHIGKQRWLRERTLIIEQ